MIIIAIFFVIVSLIGTVLLIGLCRAVSHYHLGPTPPGM